MSEEGNEGWSEHRLLVLSQLESLNRVCESHNTMLTSIDKTLQRQADSLDHHIKRTELAERQIALVDAKIEKQVAIVNDKIEPVLKKYNLINAILRTSAKVGLGIGGLISASWGLVQLIKFLKG